MCRIAKGTSPARPATLVGLAALVTLAGCGGAEPARVRVCAQATALLEGVAAIELRAATAAGEALDLRYAIDGAEAGATCRFAAHDRRRGRAKLVGVIGDRFDAPGPAALFLLETFGLPKAAAPRGGRLGPAAYLAQQLVNALAPAAIYALLALGYALIYGVVGRINLAFGEFLAYGTYVALAGAGLAAAAAFDAPALILVIATGDGVAGLALGLAASRLVFRPLHGGSSQAALIATVGLAIAAGEAMRLLGGGTQWLPPTVGRELVLWSDGAAAVALGLAQAVAVGLSLAAVAAVLVALRRTGFGRAWRATADDPTMAALTGVPVKRVVELSCVLGAACAALAGAVVAFGYGVVGFDAGRLLGFKALVAAILGGLGAPLGAALGGLLLGLLETLWSAYVASAWRDAAVMALLAVVLLVRPRGILGWSDPRDDLMGRAGRR